MKMKLFLLCVATILFTIPACAQGDHSGGTPPPSEKKTELKGQGSVTTSTSPHKVTLEPTFEIDVSNDGKERHFPFVYKFGENIFVSYSEHPDAALSSPVDAMKISRDNGKTWTEKIEHHDFYLTSMFEKHGVLYGIVYFTYPDSSVKERMVYWTSDDMGKTWHQHSGTVSPQKGKHFSTIRDIWGSMLFHRGMKVMSDGSIQGVMYGSYVGDERNRAVWVISKDDCKTWKTVSTIASGIPTTGSGHDFQDAGTYTEPTFVRVRDGSLLCVMRVDSFLPLHQSRSYDNGVTWTKPVLLPGLHGKDLESVDPQLLLMKNGILALTYGRPGTRIAFSPDGSGYYWKFSMDTSTGETTGYSGIVETGKDSLLLISDWGNQGTTGGKKAAIWGRFMHVGLVPTLFGASSKLDR